MTQDIWLSTHAYLQPVAQLQALVDAAAAGIAKENACTPIWEDYTADFQQGMPLLESPAAPIDITAAANAVMLLIENLSTVLVSGKLAQETKLIISELRREPDAPRRAVNWLLDRDECTSACPGLLRYLGWTALAHYLSPMVNSFAGWRDGERWLRSYCPTCGSRPSMAQLAGTDPGRLRFLSCGRCKTRWRYRRTGCPFCENQKDHRLAVLAVDDEGGLRIDYCEACRGYIKTYAGEGSENVLLADWTSIHLDIIARDRELNRSAESMYSLPL